MMCTRYLLFICFSSWVPGIAFPWVFFHGSNAGACAVTTHTARHKTDRQIEPGCPTRTSNCWGYLEGTSCFCSQLSCGWLCCCFPWILVLIWFYVVVLFNWLVFFNCLPHHPRAGTTCRFLVLFFLFSLDLSFFVYYRCFFHFLYHRMCMPYLPYAWWHIMTFSTTAYCMTV